MAGSSQTPTALKYDHDTASEPQFMPHTASSSKINDVPTLMLQVSDFASTHAGRAAVRALSIPETQEESEELLANTG